MQTTHSKEPATQRGRRQGGPVQFVDPFTGAMHEATSEPHPRVGQSLFGAYAQPFGFTGLPTPTYGLPNTLPYAAVASQSNPWLVQAGYNWPQNAMAGVLGTIAPFGPQPNYAALYGGFGENANRLPRVDIVDEGAEYVCQVELPGVKRENVDVSCFERGILVTANAEPDIDVGALVQSERGTSTSFRRAVNLPGAIQPSGAKATLNDGVLTINLPKANPTEGPRRVPVS